VLFRSNLSGELRGTEVRMRSLTGIANDLRTAMQEQVNSVRNAGNALLAFGAVGMAATAAVAAAGWAAQWRHGSRGGSIYYWITEPGEEGERYSLRISDHHAPGGAGWNEERQERHAEPDINIVIRRGAGGEYTFDLAPLVETIGK
jgi:hypothetical protein